MFSVNVTLSIPVGPLTEEDAQLLVEGKLDTSVVEELLQQSLQYLVEEQTAADYVVSSEMGGEE